MEIYLRTCMKHKISGLYELDIDLNVDCARLVAGLTKVEVS